jgi:hypothetical protein
MELPVFRVSPGSLQIPSIPFRKDKEGSGIPHSSGIGLRVRDNIYLAFFWFTGSRYTIAHKRISQAVGGIILMHFLFIS